MIAEVLLAMMAVATTDQTVDVAKGTKLSVNNFAGDVVIKTWGRDAVRVEVNHSDRETVEIKQLEQTVSVRSRSTRGGPSRSLDYNITVPAWMGITVNGTYADVCVAMAVTNPSLGHHGISAFILEKGMPGFYPGKKENKLGLRASDLRNIFSASSTRPSFR